MTYSYFKEKNIIFTADCMNPNLPTIN